ncbi:MAG: glycosyltransferase [Candidatus Bathyarchaeia archaeon]|jgi:glycosyltransferase involved in cell wall biosynthesis
METLVTVGICVRNGENMLRNAVESVINQDFPHERLQIIFVDDGSRDKTSKIIKDYTRVLGEKAKFFQNSSRGLGHARNLIVNNADGRYLLFVDADEVLTSGYVKEQISVMEKNPKVGVTAGIFKIVPDNMMLNLEVIPNIVDQLNFLKPRSFIWKTDKLIGAGGSTFRVKALRQVNGFDERISGSGEDTDLVFRIRKAGWLIRPNTAELIELHGGLSKPKDLWKKYFWYGYGSQRTFRQTKGAFSLPRMTPIGGFVAGIFYSFQAYRFLGKKTVFLLPFHYGLKRAAWTFGFMKGQIQDFKLRFWASSNKK